MTTELLRQMQKRHAKQMDDFMTLDETVRNSPRGQAMAHHLCKFGDVLEATLNPVLNDATAAVLSASGRGA